MIVVIDNVVDIDIDVGEGIDHRDCYSAMRFSLKFLPIQESATSKARILRSTRPNSSRDMNSFLVPLEK